MTKMGFVFKEGWKYISTLKDPEVKERYESKMKMCGNIDPYCTLTKDCVKNFQLLPQTTMIDLILYLVEGTQKFKSAYQVLLNLIEGTSYYTLNQFKAYKSLLAYKLFLNGWVKDMLLKQIPKEDKILLLGRVKHSLNFSDTPLKVWILCKNDGSILTAHCDCVAGLGEVCTHVATILFMVEYLVKLPELKSVTDLKSKWPVPSCKEVEPSTLQDAVHQRRMVYATSTQAPIFNVDEILSHLVEKQYPAALARVVPPFNDQHTVPRSTVSEPEVSEATMFMLSKDTLVVSSHFNVAFEDMSLKELQCLGRSMNLSISEQKARYIEKITRFEIRKGKCRPLWQKFRSGRVTGSNFKDVCVGNLEKPCKTTLLKVCYPTDLKKIPKAIAYGWTNEVIAIKCFVSASEDIHDAFEVKECGLIISITNPIFASTPDALCSCSCCEEAVIEVKCPITLAFEGTINNFAKSPNTYLNWDTATGVYTLDKKHAYYFQCQLQMFTTERNLCYFILWTPREWIKVDIRKDEEFWKVSSKKAERYIYEVAYPELLGHFYSKRMSISIE